MPVRRWFANRWVLWTVVATVAVVILVGDLLIAGGMGSGGAPPTAHHSAAWEQSYEDGYNCIQNGPANSPLSTEWQGCYYDGTSGINTTITPENMNAYQAGMKQAEADIKNQLGGP
jgi:hypothetical protein